MEEMFDVIIVGAGPAGCSAGIYCGQAGLKTLILESYLPGGQMILTNKIDNYPGLPFGSNGFEISEEMKKSCMKSQALIKTETVTEIIKGLKNHKIVTAKNVYRCKAVIFATGAKPRKANIPNEEKFIGKGVHYCATCDGMFYKDKDVAVLGGGNSAFEEALFLSSICRTVKIIHRRDEFRAMKALQEKAQNKDNIQFLTNTNVTALEGTENLSALQIQDGTTIRCDALFISIGRVPASNLLKDVCIQNDQGYVITDEKLHTNIQGIFAAGDIREKSLRQIITAASDGAIAAVSVQEYLS